MAEIDDAQLVLHWHYDPAATGANAVPGLVNPNGAGAFGALTQNVPYTPLSSGIGGTVPSDEVWELMADPVITFNPALTANVNPSDFALQVQLDQGNGTQGTLAPWGYWRGAPDLNPDTPGLWTDDQPAIPSMASSGALAAVRLANNPRASLADIVAVMARTYKITSSFSFTITPLGGAVDSIIDLKWYGRRWNKPDFAQYLQGKQPASGQYGLSRSVEGLAINFPLSFPAMDFTTWAQQISGSAQGTVQAWPYRTIGINTVASTLNQDLALAWNAGQNNQAQVENQYENMSFAYNPRTGTANVIDVDTWGTRTRWAQLSAGTATNLRFSAIWCASDVVSKYHPRFGRLVTDLDNPYGWALNGFYNPTNGKSRRAPKFRFPIFGDQVNVVLRDNGTATIPANAIASILRGTMVSNYPWAATNPTVLRKGAPV